MKAARFRARALPIAVFLAALLVSSAVSAKPTFKAAQEELPYLRMSLVMNSSLHLVQLPLHLQGQLELTPARAFVSFGGGLVYAGATALTFTKSRALQHAGIYTFMGASMIGAGFVSYGLVGCAVAQEPGCAVNYFNALNALILANQIVGWTLGVRQLTASKSPTISALFRRLSVVSASDGFLVRAGGVF